MVEANQERPAPSEETVQSPSVGAADAVAVTPTEEPPERSAPDEGEPVMAAEHAPQQPAAETPPEPAAPVPLAEVQPDAATVDMAEQLVPAALEPPETVPGEPAPSRAKRDTAAAPAEGSRAEAPRAAPAPRHRERRGGPGRRPGAAAVTAAGALERLPRPRPEGERAAPQGRRPGGERPTEDELAWAPPAAVEVPYDEEVALAAAAADLPAAAPAVETREPAAVGEETPAAPRPQRPERDIVPLPTSGSVTRGVVQRLEPYGAFVALEPRRVYRGLLHISQISDGRIGSVEEALTVGDEVNVKVLEVDPKRGRIALTMRGVTQPWQEALQQAQSSVEGGVPVPAGGPATLQDLAARFGREPEPPKPAPAPRRDRGAKDKEQLAAIMRRLRGE